MIENEEVVKNTQVFEYTMNEEDVKGVYDDGYKKGVKENKTEIEKLQKLLKDEYQRGSDNGFTVGLNDGKMMGYKEGYRDGLKEGGGK